MLLDMEAHKVRGGPAMLGPKQGWPSARLGVWVLNLRGGDACEEGSDKNEGAGTSEQDIKALVNRACSLWDDECDDVAAEEQLKAILAKVPEQPDALCAYGVLMQVTCGKRPTTCSALILTGHISHVHGELAPITLVEEGSIRRGCPAECSPVSRLNGGGAPLCAISLMSRCFFLHDPVLTMRPCSCVRR